ncbi:Asp23/Gls24 family envelope stress response protein [Microbacterium sp.]|uniref:Asp23/Gls24 family envelope stress response protein n=1 Tax=Microbacterium sp. TaxID=51671 RepID=UPI0033419837
MNDNDVPRLRSLGLEPEDLDGHTLEELSDYLDAGREPADASIDESPGCRIAMDALERLRRLSPELLVDDAVAEPQVEESWVQGILAGIRLDARAGRRIPFSAPEPEADLGITEGAVRGLVRGAESAVPGVLVGRCRLVGDVTETGVPVRVEMDVSVPYGDPIPDLVDRLREEVASRLGEHTELNVAGIDITVHDVQRMPEPVEEEDQ